MTCETVFTTSSPNLGRGGFARFEGKTKRLLFLAKSFFPDYGNLSALKNARQSWPRIDGKTWKRDVVVLDNRYSIVFRIWTSFWLEFSSSGMLGTKLRMLAKVTPMVKRPKKPEKKNSWTFMISKFAFNLAGYNKFGLYSDDIIYHDSPVVKEALRRLPKEVLDARNFRYFRACSCLIARHEFPYPVRYSPSNFAYLRDYARKSTTTQPGTHTEFPGAYGRPNWTFWKWICPRKNGSRTSRT